MNTRNTILLLLQLTIAFTANCTISLSPWTRKTSSPQVHIEGATAVVNNKLYLLGGFGTNDLIPTNRVDIYDPTTDTWTQGASTPYAGSHCQGTSTVPFLNQSPHELDRYIWVASAFLGQHPGQPTDGTWRYDTLNDSWVNFVKLPAARASGGLTLEGTTLHYIGGLMDRNNDASTHWTYNLTADLGYWENSTSFPDARNHVHAKTINGRIYVLGGQYHHDQDVQDINVASAFHIGYKNWTRLTNVPIPRSHSEPGTVVVYDQVVMIGGRNMFQSGGNINLDIVLAYDTENDRWTFLRNLPEKRIGAAAGFFRNITVDGVTGDFIVATCGGIDWDNGATDTWISQVTLQCQDDGTATDSNGWESTDGTYVPSSTSAPSSNSPSSAPSATASAEAVSESVVSGVSAASDSAASGVSDEVSRFSEMGSSVSDLLNDSSSASTITISVLMIVVTLFL